LQALAEQSRIVRLPLNKVGLSNKIIKAYSQLEQEFEREPSTEELAEYELLLKYQQSETEFRITFDEFKDSTKLAAAKTAITNKMTLVSVTEKM
jgi:DNA-directed RNA polymerase specialized sigma subunit